jgi:DNA replication and repair protein RecF
MTLSELKITNLRNIRSAELLLHSRLNIVQGINGSGKTSFLEALYLLSSGHSFRTREISALVTHKADKLTIFTKTLDGQQISIQRSPNLSTTARIDGKPCLTNSELAMLLPCQIFYQDIFQLIDAGPLLRRRLLDWGVFHVEHGYHLLWKSYWRALKQRNTLLKKRAPNQQLLPWNAIIVDLANQLDALRRHYFDKLNQLFIVNVKRLTTLDCELTYYKGWDKKGENRSLADILIASYDHDSYRQTTTYGAHHADLLVVSKHFKVKHYLSRGQQKMLLFALKFAQATLLAKPCLFLIDDISTELDNHHLGNLCQFIGQSSGQFFITQRLGDILSSCFSNQDKTLIDVNEGIFTSN